MGVGVVSPVFIGRREEVASVAALMGRAQAGEPAFALVGGEAGVGKTRLVSELAARAAGAGFLVLTGQCVELGAEGLPLVPLVDALRALARTMRPEALAEVLGPAGPGLARLLPSPAGDLLRVRDLLSLPGLGLRVLTGVSGGGRSHVIALWKGPGQEALEIPLEPGAQGILLSADAVRTARRSYDGRRPLANGSQFCDVTIRQIRASTTGSVLPDSHARWSSQAVPSRAVLEADELTILTSWAEAAADALVFAPKRIEALPAAAQAGASWRAGLRIPEPSSSLDHAISSMTRAVRSAAATSSGPPLDALLQGIGDSQPGEPALDRLVRAVLRSALEHRQARRARELIGRLWG
jgi:AAA ATPase domain